MAKKTRGRPAVDTEAVNLRLPREMIEVVDAQRRDEEDLPTRPAMIRRMLKQWCHDRGIDVEE
ncbi:ribbon-helix-helix protein, CopG family [Leisingera daeponensis]|uniref:ribbon-helix-helix protein, CopG family n=1 Tax=Leisingera daeponensis TaxID=405746 RepID=UPI0012B5910B|nr:ribbon-helix-helix protein, CopG family [Leisingera daeponensis]